jgi:hypothetical protein
MQTVQGKARKLKQVRASPVRREPPMPQSERTWTRMQIMATAFTVAVVSACLYLPTLRHPFISFDDPDYVTENAHVRKGLNWETVRWAWTSLEHANWHPITWIAHAADVQTFGLTPAGHHLTSLILHAANAGLLFLFFAKVTRSPHCSFVVAALFAVHPFNVESVAWVAERKSLLSAFWSMLTLLAYAGYVNKPGLKRLAVVSGFFFLALASKPMAITLPFLLLVLDRWPFERVSSWKQLLTTKNLWVEKGLLIALSVGSGIVTVVAQHRAHSISSLTAVPLPLRFENAIISCAWYAWKLVWPSGLAILYPWPLHPPPILEIGAAAIFLIITTTLVWNERERRPHLMTGWLWFLGTLVPVIGILQVGPQARADRYDYIPMIGLLVAAVWSMAQVAERWPRLRVAVVIAVASVLTASSLKQIGYWRSDYDLWSHALRVTTDNYIASDKVGLALQTEGRYEEALSYFEQSLGINSTDPLANFNVGANLQLRGRVRDALPLYQVTANQDTDPILRAQAFENLGAAYWQLGDLQAARENYLKALHYDPQQKRIYGALRELQVGLPAHQ